jgi:hypothetical protein
MDFGCIYLIQGRLRSLVGEMTLLSGGRIIMSKNLTKIDEKWENHSSTRRLNCLHEAMQTAREPSTVGWKHMRSLKLKP